MRESEEKLQRNGMDAASRKLSLLNQAEALLKRQRIEPKKAKARRTKPRQARHKKQRRQARRSRQAKQARKHSRRRR
jgi:hypothetical protein